MFGPSSAQIESDAAATGAQEASDVRAREAEMFGPSPSDKEASPRRKRPLLPSDVREPTPGGVLRRLSDRVDELDDNLAIGGTMWLQLQASVLDEGPVEESVLSSPNLVDVYLDGRPNDRLRGFIQGRLTYDPTSGQADGLGGTAQATQVQLDQLWMRFDLYRTVFVTAGKQRIRWGSGRLWNPTDFLNQQRLNPISLFDIRLGVPLLKFHLPVESLGWNFYAVANLDEATELKRVGGALRAEILLGNVELSVSAALRSGDAQRFGIDVTTPIWDFDVRVELAVLHDDPTPRLAPFNDAVLSDDVLDRLADGLVDAEDIFTQYVPAPESRRNEWIPQMVAGAEIAIRYSDTDSLILGLEYFYNDQGYDDESVYPRLLLAGRFNPLDVGRHYLGFFATLAAPGQWDQTSIFLSGIANLSDLSGVVRGDFSLQLLTFLSFRLFANVFWGTGAFSPRFSIDPRIGDVILSDLDSIDVLADRVPVSAVLRDQLAGTLGGSDGVGGGFGALPIAQVGAALVIRL